MKTYLLIQTNHQELVEKDEDFKHSIVFFSDFESKAYSNLYPSNNRIRNTIQGKRIAVVSPRDFAGQKLTKWDTNYINKKIKEYGLIPNKEYHHTYIKRNIKIIENRINKRTTTSIKDCE